MKRILQCIGSLGYGGSQTFLMEVYRKIDRTRIQFDFVVFPESIEGFYPEVAQLGGRVYVCPRYNGKNHMAFQNWWISFFREHPEYTIIHGHVRSVAVIYLSIAKRYGLTTVVHSHSTSNGSGISSLVKGVMQYPLRYTADWLLACSDTAGKWLYGKQATRSAHYQVVPNCVDTERFRFSAGKRSQIRERLKIAETDVVYGHVGRFTVPKNHDFLVRAFAKIYANKKNAWLMLIGSGVLMESAQVLSHELGIQDRVLFLGIQKQPEAFYSAMDVFLFPSLWEGMPMTVVEAQVSGLPCYLSDTVTRNVKLTSLVQYLPIDAGTDPWLCCARDCPGQRKDVIQPVIDAGFDSCTVAEKLMHFYEKISQ